MERKLDKKYGSKLHHSFNVDVKKKDPNVILTSLPSPPHSKKHFDRESNLVENLHGILAKISI